MKTSVRHAQEATRRAKTHPESSVVVTENVRLASGLLKRKSGEENRRTAKGSNERADHAKKSQPATHSPVCAPTFSKSEMKGLQGSQTLLVARACCRERRLIRNEDRGTNGGGTTYLDGDSRQVIDGDAGRRGLSREASELAVNPLPGDRGGPRTQRPSLFDALMPQFKNASLPLGCSSVAPEAPQSDDEKPMRDLPVDTKALTSLWEETLTLVSSAAAAAAAFFAAAFFAEALQAEAKSASSIKQRRMVGVRLGLRGGGGAVDVERGSVTHTREVNGSRENVHLLLLLGLCSSSGSSSGFSVSLGLSLRLLLRRLPLRGADTMRVTSDRSAPWRANEDEQRRDSRLGFSDLESLCFGKKSSTREEVPTH
jgi:hypothetical protein